MAGPRDYDHWAENAADWIAWARTPDHDAFWAYRRAFADFVGQGHGSALDVGCGEGRQSRLLTELGYDVTACEPALPLLDAARQLSSANHYLDAPATALPLPDATFDLVLSYNVLMDLDDPGAALAEMSRVLAPTGRLILSVVHPLANHLQQPTTPADNDPQPAPVSYFERRAFEGVETRDGLTMTFRGWSMPLSRYTQHLNEAHLAITRIAEPQPDPASPWPRTAYWSRVPLFLWIEARKLP